MCCLCIAVAAILLCVLQVTALQSANATLSEALVLAREELSGKPGGSLEQQLAAVSNYLNTCFLARQKPRREPLPNRHCDWR
jgi:hypothetical protein